MTTLFFYGRQKSLQAGYSKQYVSGLLKYTGGMADWDGVYTFFCFRARLPSRIIIMISICHKEPCQHEMKREQFLFRKTTEILYTA